jgi:precorrin-6A/cobalt-precorrin-6A reductase
VILVLGGTSEARVLSALLQDRECRVLLTAVSGYGGDLAKASGVNGVRVGRLDGEGLWTLIENEGIAAVVDATHPHAGEISRLAISTCRKLGVDYYRLERPAAQLPDNPLVHVTGSYGEAANLASKLGNVIFLTIGSRRLEEFMGSADLTGKRLIARVLPEPEALAACRALGFPPDNIIAARGPFSEALNRAWLREYRADVMITKESGETGGVDSKIAAALSLGIPVVVIERPRLDYGGGVFSDPIELAEFLTGREKQ